MTDHHGNGQDGSPASSARGGAAVVARFGGIRPMATKLGVAVTTVQGWKERDHIPAPRYRQILDAAAEHGIPLAPEDFEAPPAALPGALESEGSPAWGETAEPSPGATDFVMVADPDDADGSEVGDREDREATVPDEDREPADVPLAEAATMPPPRRRGGAVWAFRLAVLLVVLAAGAGGWVWWRGGDPVGLPVVAGWFGEREAATAPAGPPPGEESAVGRARVESDIADAAPVGEPGQGTGAGAPASRDDARMESEATAARAAPENAPPAAPARAVDVAGLEAAVAGLEAELAALDAETRRLATALDDLDAILGRIGAIDDRLAALEETPPAAGGVDPARLAALDQRLAAVEAGVPAADGARLAEVEDRIAGLEAAGDAGDRMARLEARIAALHESTGDGTAALEARLAALEAAPETRFAAPPAGLADAALLLSVGQLREAARGAGAWRAELDTFMALAGDDPALAGLAAPLSAGADTGIPTVAMLRRGFAAMAGDIVLAGRMPEDPDWVDRALGQVASLVTVRRTGADVAGETTEARVARAEALLAADDLAGAADAVAGIDGGGAALAADWLVRARARLAVDRALRLLQAAIIERAGGPGGDDGG